MEIKLKINNIFKNLIRPLSPDEYRQLEANLRSEGCREPIVTWNGYIVDGHNRYEICTRLGIEFQIKETTFESNEDAITWICANQLGRRNISEETRKYLIGKRYDAEKIIGLRKTSRGVNQFSLPEEDDDDEEDGNPETVAGVRYRTAQRLGQEYHVSHTTVQKYGKYSRALDRIGQKEPDIIPRILSGQVKVSHENLLGMADLNTGDLRRIGRRIAEQGDSFVPYSDSRKELLLADSRGFRRQPQSNTPSVKDMPVFDPDAEVTGLTLTIPTWASSIERVKSRTDISTVSDDARLKLRSALSDLQRQVENMLASIKGETDT